MKSVRKSGECALDPSVSALILAQDSVQAPSGSASLWLVVCGILISDRNNFTIPGGFESIFIKPADSEMKEGLG